MSRNSLISWNPKFTKSLRYTLSWGIYPVHTFTFCIIVGHFNFILTSMLRSPKLTLRLRLLTKILYAYLISFMQHQSHLLSFDHPCIRWSEENIKFLSIYFHLMSNVDKHTSAHTTSNRGILCQEQREQLAESSSLWWSKRMLLSGCSQ